MKKYVVLSKTGIFAAHEERQFDKIDDARMFKNLLTISGDNIRKYYIAEVLE